MNGVPVVRLAPRQKHARMTSSPPLARTALIVGVTGLSGSSLSRLLVAEGWTVYGLS